MSVIAINGTSIAISIFLSYYQEKKKTLTLPANKIEALPETIQQENTFFTVL